MATRKKRDTVTLLALICKALTERYSADQCKPGIQVSHLAEKALWYVAIHRYSLPYGEGRIVVRKETGDDLDAVLERIAQTLAPSNDAQRELARYLNT
jgi:hypothetical protein